MWLHIIMIERNKSKRNEAMPGDLVTDHITYTESIPTVRNDSQNDYFNTNNSYKSVSL